MRRVSVKMAVCIVAAVMLLVWMMYVFCFNQRIRARDDVPVLYFDMGEYVPLDNNYTYGEYAKDYEVCVNGYEIMDTAEYLYMHNSEFADYGCLPEKICMVYTSIRYTGDMAPLTKEEDLLESAQDRGKNTGLNISSFMMCGLDYYESQNPLLYNLENPNAEGDIILLKPGESQEVTLVFNIERDNYTAYSWRHIEELERMIYLTAYPVQKNIVINYD